MNLYDCAIQVSRLLSCAPSARSISAHFFYVMIMATVTLAAINIAGVLLGLDPYTTVVFAALITVVYSATSGLWGVVSHTTNGLHVAVSSLFQELPRDNP